MIFLKNPHVHDRILFSPNKEGNAFFGNDFDEPGGH